MELVVTILLLVVLVVVGALAFAAYRGARSFADANEVIPGVPTNAPSAWAGAHSTEARLHRRLRDAMTALRANRSLDQPDLVGVREALEQEALAVDDRLVAAAALPKAVRDAPLQRVAEAVEAIEATVAEIVALRGPGAGDTEQALADVRTRLALVADARAELELLSSSGGSATLDELRRSIEAERAVAEAAPADSPEPGTPDADGPDAGGRRDTDPPR